MENAVTKNGVTCDGPIPVTRPGYLYPGGCDAVTGDMTFSSFAQVVA